MGRRVIEIVIVCACILTTPLFAFEPLTPSSNDEPINFSNLPPIESEEPTEETVSRGLELVDPASPDLKPTPGEIIAFSLPESEALNVVVIPTGSFQMGSSGDKGWSQPMISEPEHRVTIKRDFALGEFEVTQAQWKAVMGKWPGNSLQALYGFGDDYPMYNVTEDDMKAFLEKLNGYVKKTDQGRPTFRLPTEAEWEYAARARTATRFPFGQSTCQPLDCNTLCDLDEKAWFCANAKDHSHVVGLKEPNAFGLYDMEGNVAEWCADSYIMGYKDAPTDGSARIDPKIKNRVLRGGAWSSHPVECTSSYRALGTAKFRSPAIGFRVVWEP